MDPYLEHPGLWPDVRNSLIAEIRRYLSPRVRPKYYVGIEERTYMSDSDDFVLVGRADAAVRAAREASGEQPAAVPNAAPTGTLTVELPMSDRVPETYLKVRSVEDGRVVAVLELLSPSNKMDGEGRRVYERKRKAILSSLTHLVEIDLLRAGTPMPVRGAAPTASYRILVSREDSRRHASLTVFTVRDPMPPFVLPPQAGDQEPERRSTWAASSLRCTNRRATTWSWITGANRCLPCRDPMPRGPTHCCALPGQLTAVGTARQNSGRYRRPRWTWWTGRTCRSGCTRRRLSPTRARHENA